ncbi:MAG: Gfo/Idh/MocA family oxidoreductase [Treponema sp.]|nr:Gfo/Idh/MocA family oxidoreductase [Treponema sp.]MCL2237133.1 Gfo/Idh/MocA family oxidoreductase [Treponema sp.]
MEKIKAAVIGLGRIASILEEDALREKPCTHAGAIAANDDCVLAAGCDIDEERRKLFNEKWQVPVYSDAKEMINAVKPQILSIATHPDSHYEYCRLAAEMNVPVVICEKPLADKIAQAQKIEKLSRNANTIIITNHERRYSADYIRAKSILNEGKLGNLIAVRAILYMGKKTRLIDQLWHDGTHLADAVMFLTGGVLKHKRSLGAKLNSGNGTAWLEGRLYQKLISQTSNQRFGKGAKIEKSDSALSAPPRLREIFFPIPFIFEIGAGRDHLVFEMEFSCEKGRLRIGNGIFEILESVPSPYAEKFRSLINTGETFTGPTGYFVNMLKDAVACAKDPAKQPVSGAIDGLRVIEYLNSVKAWRPIKARRSRVDK